MTGIFTGGKIKSKIKGDFMKKNLLVLLLFFLIPLSAWGKIKYEAKMEFYTVMVKKLQEHLSLYQEKTKQKGAL